MQFNHVSLIRRNAVGKFILCAVFIIAQSVFNTAFAEPEFSKIWDFDNADNYSVTGNTAFENGLVKGTLVSNINLEQIGSWGEDSHGVVFDVTTQGQYAYAAKGSGVVVIDISDPTASHVVGAVDTPGHARAISVSGSYAYVADSNSGLQIVDVSNPSAPLIVGAFDAIKDNQGFPRQALDVSVSGSHAYVASGHGGLQIIDISNPEAPIKVKSVGRGYSSSVTVKGNYAYVALSYATFLIVDISTPEAAKVVANIEVDTVNDLSEALHGIDVSVVGDYAYVLFRNSNRNDSGRIYIINISNPLAPFITNSIGSFTRFVYGLAVTEGYIYVANGIYNGLEIIDISKPVSPKRVGSISTPGSATAVNIRGNYAFVANYDRGLQVVDVNNPSSPTIVDSISIEGDARDISINGNYAYIADGSKGLQIVDIRNPSKPDAVGSIITNGFARGVALSGEYAFLAETNGMKVIDISDPTLPNIVGSINKPEWGRSFDVTVSGNNAYLVGHDIGLQIIDISDPSSPVIKGAINGSGITSDVSVIGNYAYVAAYNQKKLRVIDIRNPSLPVTVGSVDIQITAEALSVREDYAYVVSRYGLKIVDVSNPESPLLVGELQTPGESYGIDLNKNYAYVADYDGGIQVIDISHPTTPIIVESISTSGYSRGIDVNHNYAYIADGVGGLKIFKSNNVSTDFPTVTTKNGFTYNQPLIAFSEILGASNKGVVSYQLINNSTAYYHDGTNWVISSNESQTNLAGEINQYINTFHEVAGYGELKFKVFFTGYDTQVFELDRVYIATRLDGDGDGYYDDEDVFPNDPNEWADNDQDSLGDNTDLDDDNDGIPDVWEVANSLNSLNASDAKKDNDSDGFTNYQEYIASTNPNDGSSVPPSYKYWGFDQSGEYKVTENTRIEGGLAAGNVTSESLILKQIGSWGENSGISDTVERVVVRDRYAYVLKSGTGLHIIDISDPILPVTKGSIDTPGYTQDISIDGNYAYIADRAGGLQVIDVSHPSEPNIIGEIETTGDAVSVHIVDDYAYVAMGSKGIQIVDISNPASPVSTGLIDTPGSATSVTVDGNYAYVADYYNGLQVVDVSNPRVPLIIGAIDTPGLARGIKKIGSYVYVADDNNVQIIDISDPMSPNIINVIDTLGLGSAQDISFSASGSYAYVADYGNGLQVADIRDPIRSTIVGRVDTSGARAVSMNGNHAYVADGSSGLKIIEVSTRLSTVTTTRGFAYKQSLKEFAEILGSQNQAVVKYQLVNGSTAYFYNGSKWEISNDETQTNTAEEIKQHINTFHTVAGFGVLTVKAYFMGSENLIFELDSINVATRLDADNDGYYDDEDVFPGDPLEWNDNDLDGVGDNADLDDDNDGIPDLWEVANGFNPLDANDAVQDADSDGFSNYQEYFSSTNPNDNSSTPPNRKFWGFDQIVDYRIIGDIIIEDSLVKSAIATDVASLSGFVNTPGYAYDISVNEGYAYIADGSSGLQIVDISDPSIPTVVGSINTLDQAYGLSVDENYAYIADEDNGLQIINISRPTSPQMVSSIETPGRARDVSVIDNYAYVADGSKGLQIVDISNPSNPVIVGSVDTSGQSYEVNVIGSVAYVADDRQGLQVVDVSNPVAPVIIGRVDTANAFGLDVNGDYAYVADGYISDGLRIIDISDPSTPVIVGSLRIGGTARAVSVSGNYAFVVNSGGGLQIIDISNPAVPVLVKSLDTSGSAQGVSISGNHVYVADGNAGLEVIKFTPNLPSITPVSGFSYNKPLTSFDEVLGGSNQATVRYQLIVDGSASYYHNGTDWIVSNDKVQTNTAAEINQYINTFHSVAGFGVLTFKAFFTGDEGSIGVLDSVSVSIRGDTDQDGYYDDEDAFPNDSTEWADNDNDLIGDNTDSDDDNDNMPDIWEIQYGLNPLDPADASLDSDKDGISNLDEYTQGTNPNGLFTWDIDGDGEAKPLTDGLLTLRYQFGFRGDALIANAVGNEAIRTSASEIAEFLAAGDIRMDIDGDDKVQPLTDGLLLLRYLFGFRGDALINNAVGDGATRNSTEEIDAYVQTVLPQ